MTWKPELDELARREAFAREMGGVDKVKRQRDQGRLTVRERIAQSQALPDPEMYQAGLLILGQVQQLQLTLNSLFTDMTAVRNLAAENKWANDKNFNYKTDELMRSVVRVQDSVFSVYNAGYELTMRCR